jgi:hypothetical protein
VLDGLFVTPAVTAIVEALASAAATEGPVVVIGNAKLATALRATREVITVGVSPRAAKKLGETLPDIGSIAGGSCAALVGVDVTDDAAWEATLRAWSRVVRDGGAIVIVDKGHAEEASRRALCAGLTEIEQRHAGRTIVTSGLVTHDFAR